MTCQSSDLACHLDAITAALNAGPDDWTIAAVIIAGIGVLASTAVALAALKASSRAVDIAANADKREAQRDAREDTRDAERQRDRVDRWLAEFLVEAVSYAASLDVLAKESTRRRLSTPSERAWEQDHPYPDGAAMLSTLEAARLVARGDDERTLGLTAAHARHIPMMSRENAMVTSQRLAGELRDWRNGSTSRGEFESYLRSKPGERGFPPAPPS